MSDGFLGRWSRRKDAVRKGEGVAPEPEQRASEASPPRPSPGGGGSEENSSSTALAGSLETSTARAGSPEKLPPPPGEGAGGGAPAHEPPPTLEDTRSLTPDSDFTRFTGPGVAPEVRTAAFKKLFADPHFNVMDGLDVYIDDYSKPDPIPPEMLKSLVSAKFLKLFDEEEKKDEENEEPQASAPREVADQLAAENVAQSGTLTDPVLPAGHHADPDLRLQQDDAPGPEGPGARAR